MKDWKATGNYTELQETEANKEETFVGKLVVIKG